MPWRLSPTFHDPVLRSFEKIMSEQSPTDRYLFLGTHGHVIAIDKTDGTTVWETSLPKTGYQVVVILYEDDKLLCATAGRAFALDPVNGRILWENGLPKLGQGVVALCTRKQSIDLASVVAAQEAANRTSTSSTTTTMTPGT